MAQVQILPHQYGYQDHCLPRSSFAQPQAESTFDLSSSGTSYQFDDFGHIPSMAQQLVQQHRMPEPQMRHPGWSHQDSSPRGYKPDPSSCTQSSIRALPSSMEEWAAPETYTDTFGWDNGLPREPFIVSESNDNFLRNGGLVYGQTAVQNMIGKGSPSHLEQYPWMASGPVGVPRGTSFNGSDLDTNNSQTPKTYLSDAIESASFSPGSMPDQASPSVNWIEYSSSFQPVKESSPTSVPSYPRYGLRPSQKLEPSADTDWPVGTTALSLQRAGPYRQDVNHSIGLEATTRTGPEQPYSQGGSFDTPSWYDTSYSHDVAGLPVQQQVHQSHHAQRESDIAVAMANENCQTEYRSDPWTESRAPVSNQDRFQDRFTVLCTADAQAQRKQNDDMLIQGKKEGLTYKDIRNKMVGEKPAESTLRGRFRSLTKARKDRVRKPTWTPKDMKLLNEIVDTEFSRINNMASFPQAMTQDQKLVKVPWKKVADFILKHGGSYHFGNSTCKRKWLEINKHA